MKMKHLLPFALTLLLGCAGTAPGNAVAEENAVATESDAAVTQDAEQPTLDERLDALLKEAPTADGYRELSNCLSRHKYRRVEILNDEYLLFSRNQNYWLNHLRIRCISLTRNKILTFTSHGSSICRGDQSKAGSDPGRRIRPATKKFDVSRGPLGLDFGMLQAVYYSVTAGY